MLRLVNNQYKPHYSFTYLVGDTLPIGAKPVEDGVIPKVPVGYIQRKVCIPKGVSKKEIYKFMGEFEELKEFSGWSPNLSEQINKYYLFFSE